MYILASINAQIKDMVNTCSICIDHRNQQPAEPLLNHDIPITPWTKVSTDVFHLYGKSYLTIVDYTTRFFDLHQIQDCESKTIINKLKNTFAKFGIPHIQSSFLATNEKYFIPTTTSHEQILTPNNNMTTRSCHIIKPPLIYRKQ